MDIILLLILTAILINRPDKAVKFVGIFLLVISIMLCLLRYAPQSAFSIGSLLFIITAIVLLSNPNNNAKTAGKVMLGIILVPVIGFIILFISCITMIGAGSIFR